MITRNVRLVVLLVVLATVAAWFATRSLAPVPVQVAAQPRRPNPGRESSPLTAVPPAQMIEALHAQYRLFPDRRCLGALARAREWLAGGGASLTLRFENARWRIGFGDDVVGELPEFPDFDDCDRLLTESVVRWAGGAPPDGEVRALSPPQSTDPLELLESLRSLDSKQPKVIAMPAEDLARAAQALTLVSLQSLDRMEIADRVQATAWASMAIAGARTKYDLRVERALLADNLGYPSAAARIAAELPATHPVGAFLRADDATLQKAATARDADEMTRLLVLRRLTASSDYPAWTRWIRAHYATRVLSLPVLQSALEMRAFFANRTFPQVMPYLVLAAVGRGQAGDERARALDMYLGVEGATAAVFAATGKALGISQGQLMARYDDTMESTKQNYPGPILDHATYRAFMDGYFFSAHDAFGRHLLDEYSSVPAAEKFLAELSGGRGAAATAFTVWYAHLVDSERGKTSIGDLSADLDGAHPLGGPPRQRTFEALAPHLNWGDPRRFDAVQRLTRRHDTRPAHVAYVAAKHWSYLEDVNRAEPLYRHVQRVADSRYPSSAVFFAAVTRDDARLKRYLSDPAFPLWGKLQALDRLASRKEKGPVDVGPEYRRLVVQHPEDSSLAMQYSEYLLEHQRWDEARRAAETWLGLKLPVRGLERVVLQTNVAQAYLGQGRFAEALAAVEPAAQSGKGSALKTQADILEQSGKLEDAEGVLADIVRRYPQSFQSRVHQAQFLWRRERWNDAAQTLKAFPGGAAPVDWWNKVTPAFDETLTAFPDEKVLAAFDAIIASGVSHDSLRSIPRRFMRTERNALAFQMRERLHGPDAITELESRLSAYEALRKWKGDEEALAWLKQRLPMNVRNQMSTVFFEEEVPELMWSLIGTPDPNDGPEWVWIFRAAAALRFGDRDPEHIRAIDAYLAATTNEDGRLLVGFLRNRVPESEVWTRARDARTRADTAYYVGLKRLCDGDYRTASDWFRVVWELSPTTMVEWSLAKQELRKWYEQSLVLDLLKPACGPSEPGPEKRSEGDAEE